MRAEQQRLDDQRTARMLFQSVVVLNKLFSGSGKSVEFMNEFDWLFTAEEHRDAKRRRLMAALQGQGDANGGHE